MTATLPDDFELREGEEFDFHAVAVNGGLVVTRVVRSTPRPPDSIPRRSTSFTAKWGRSMAKVVEREAREVKPMRLLLDTNILLDVILTGRTGNITSTRILDL